MNYFFIAALLVFSSLNAATLKHTSMGMMKHIAGVSGKPTVVMLGTPTCPFCVSTEEAIKELSYVYDKKVNFLSIDIEQFPDAGMEFSVKATPTLLIYGADGILKERRTGGMTVRGFEKKLAEFGIIP